MRHNVLLTEIREKCRDHIRDENRQIKFKINRVRKELRVDLKLSVSEHVLSMTIDTGAQISILKPRKLYDDTKVKYKRRVQIMGIIKHKPIESIGTANAKIISEGCELNFEFHIVTHEINIETDGLMGSDFLEAFNGIIDYKNNNLSLTMNIMRRDKNINKQIESPNEIKKDKIIKEIDKEENKESCKKNILTKNKGNKNFYDEVNTEIIEAKSMRELVPHKIENKDLNITEIFYNKRYDDEILFYDDETEITNKIERKNYIIERLVMDQCNKEEKKELGKICEKFSEAFFIKGDPFKKTDVAEHIIQLKPNTKPMYTRQYRLPE